MWAIRRQDLAQGYGVGDFRDSPSCHVPRTDLGCLVLVFWRGDIVSMWLGNRSVRWTEGLPA